MKLRDLPEIKSWAPGKVDSIAAEALRFAGQELASVVVDPDWPHRAVMACERGLFVCEDLPKEQHAGAWAFRSRYQPWEATSNPDVAVTIFDDERRSVRLEMWLGSDWSGQIDLTWDGDDAAALEEFALVCLNRGPGST